MTIKIGIVGGGQLGKMLIQAARQLSFPLEIHVYDAQKDACAIPLADNFTIGSFDDAQKIGEFLEKVDITTYEFENINPVVFEGYENKCLQGQEALRVFQNRLFEKEWINELDGLKTVPYKVVDENFSMPYPYIIKTISTGYDGKGQTVIHNENEQELYVEEGMVAEQFLTEMVEFSLVAGRKKNGEYIAFPPFKNKHSNQILDHTEFADIDDRLTKQMVEKSKLIMDKLQYVGVLTVEYFFDGKTLYVNEVAPRVHNSGHITLDACNMNQFELHLRCLLNMQLPEIQTNYDYAMINVLGQHYENIKMYETLPGIFYDYEKEPRNNRKVGHINCLKENLIQIKGVRDR